MSGVYIKGVEMPTKDGVYTLRIWGTGQIEMLDGYHSFLLSGVKAVPVTDHGRLIDADELYDLLDGGYDLDFDEVPETKAELLAMIKRQVTIIPADKDGAE